MEYNSCHSDYILCVLWWSIRLIFLMMQLPQGFLGYRFLWECVLWWVVKSVLRAKNVTLITLIRLHLSMYSLMTNGKDLIFKDPTTIIAPMWFLCWIRFFSSFQRLHSRSVCFVIGANFRFFAWFSSIGWSSIFYHAWEYSCWLSFFFIFCKVEFSSCWTHIAH